MADKFVRYVKIVDKDKNAWRIRYSLVEAWASIIDELEKETLKKDVV